MHPPVGLIGGGHAEVCGDFVIVSMPKHPDIVFEDTEFVVCKGSFASVLLLYDRKRMCPMAFSQFLRATFLGIGAVCVLEIEHQVRRIHLIACKQAP